MPTVSAGGYVRSIVVRTRVSCYAPHDVLPFPSAFARSLTVDTSGPPMIEAGLAEADEVEAIE
jgi:hypothetical protein